MVKNVFEFPLTSGYLQPTIPNSSLEGFMKSFSCWLLIFVLIGLSSTGSAQNHRSAKLTAYPPDALAELEKWRAEYESDVKSETGWLSIRGLFWLKPGANLVGSAADNVVVLPAEAAPARVGVITLDGKKARLAVQAGVPVAVNGKAVTETDLKTDADGKADMITLGTLSFYIIVRGEKIGVRLKDTNNPALRNFPGVHWFEPNGAFRVEARFVPYNPPKILKITNVLGDVSDVPSAGYVEFRLLGKKCRLDVQQADDRLFVNFKDRSAGVTTYGAGRFLEPELPKNGKVMIDFNRAYNPPCAYTEFATCPLPPPQNALPVAIEAGEKKTH